MKTGAGADGTVAETELKKELAIVNSNCTSIVHLAKYVVQHMTAEDSGRIWCVCGEGIDLSLAKSIRYM